MPTMKTEAEKVVEKFGAYRIAKAVGVRHQSVYTWVRRGKIPAKRVLQVEEITGVSRHILRPDVFGPAPEHNQDRAA